MTFTHALATNNYGPAKFIVSTNAYEGTHTTLASAMTAASVGDTIFLRTSVTENVTITPGVNITAWAGGSANTPSITGKLTMSGAGTSNISGITLITNSDFAIAVTGSAASILNLINCYLSGSNNTIISYSSSSSSSAINCYQCTSNLATTGIGIYSQSSAGTLLFNYCTLNNTGASTTASTISAGTVAFTQCGNFCPLSASSTGTIVLNSGFINSSNTTCITLSGTSSAAIHQSVAFSSGTSSALVIGAGCTANIYDTIEVFSSNTNAITGSGTIGYGQINYIGSSSTNNVTTQTANKVQTASTVAYTPLCGGTTANGVLQSVASTGTSGQVLTSNGSAALPTFQAAPGTTTLLQTQTASNVASIAFSSTFITATYNNYLLLYHNVTAATNAVTFQIQFSTNNGSTYLNTGYDSTANTATATSTSAVLLSNGALFSSTGQGSGSYYLYDMTNGGTPNGSGTCAYPASNGSNAPITGANGFYGPSSTTVNNIKIFFSSGNILTGTFSLYGITS